MIAGSLPESTLAGPGSTYTPITLAHATLQPGAELTLPWQPDFNALVYVLGGAGHASAPSAGRCGPASSPCSAPATP